MLVSKASAWYNPTRLINLVSTPVMRTNLKSRPEPDQNLPSQRDAVLRSAARLFRKKGYAQTTVRELAKEVGLQSGSLFHHFKSKDEILAEVMEKGLILASGHVMVAIAQETTPRKRLETLFRSYLTALLSDEHRDYMTVLLYDFRSLPPELGQRVHRVRKALVDRWQEVLDEAVPPGHISNRLKAQFIFGAMNWALQWYNPKGALGLEELAGHFTELALATCGFSAQYSGSDASAPASVSLAGHDG